MVTFDPSQPCRCPPGSYCKSDVLAARYAAGLPLFLDEDATHEANDGSWAMIRPPGTQHLPREEHVFHVYDDSEDD
jgi:hypothetical protein